MIPEDFDPEVMLEIDSEGRLDTSINCTWYDRPVVVKQVAGEDVVDGSHGEQPLT